MNIFFGDSHTAGDPARADTARLYFPWNFSLLRGEGQPSNHAVGGQISEDQTDVIWPLTFGSGQRVFYMIGTNNWLSMGYDATALSWFDSNLIAQSRRIVGVTANVKGNPNISFAGTWGDTGLHALVGRYTFGSGVGSAMTVAFDGPTFILGFTQFNVGNPLGAAPGSFQVKIDGIDKGTFSAVPQHVISAVSGRCYGAASLRIDSLGAGAHVAVVEPLESGKCCSFDWVGTGAQNGANLYLMTAPVFQESKYPGQSAGGIAYNSRFAGIVSALNAEGMTNVKLIDIAAGIDPEADMWTDGSHMANVGHTKTVLMMNAALV